jgi:hypothetical protein
MDNLLFMQISVWLLAKAFFVFGFFLYIIFAFVVQRQVNMMTNTLELTFEKPIKALAIIHLLFSIAVFILALLIL